MMAKATDMRVWRLRADRSAFDGGELTFT